MQVAALIVSGCSVFVCLSNSLPTRSSRNLNLVANVSSRDATRDAIGLFTILAADLTVNPLQEGNSLTGTLRGERARRCAVAA